jgi:DinB superfamily
MNDLAYPIGKFVWEGPTDASVRARRIGEIAAAPAALRKAVADLTEAQLDTPYRQGGWTVRQVAHHVPDSHINAYVRFKLAVTEDSPTIKPYDEAAWAKLADVKTVPVATSLALLDAVHERWVALLRSLGEADWARTFRHPELGVVPLEKNLALYAWHGRHHVAHVTALRERMGWG